MTEEPGRLPSLGGKELDTIEKLTLIIKKKTKLQVIEKKQSK